MLWAAETYQKSFLLILEHLTFIKVLKVKVKLK